MCVSTAFVSTWNLPTSQIYGSMSNCLPVLVCEYPVI